eukprot:365197-Chlamydomonas_euryale.AAC.4
MQISTCTSPHLTASHTAARVRRHQEFVQLALRPAGLPSGQQRSAATSSLHKGMLTAWCGPCPNRGLSVLWRAAINSPLARADVWLLRPPSAAVEPAVWAPVCAMALDAMEHGRAVLWARLAGGAGNAAA